MQKSEFIRLSWILWMKSNLVTAPAFQPWAWGFLAQYISFLEFLAASEEPTLRALPQICEIKLNIMNNYLTFNIFTFQILINKIFKNTPYAKIYFSMPKVHQRLVLGQTSSEKGPSPPSQCHMLGPASDQAVSAHPSDPSDIRLISGIFPHSLRRKIANPWH